MVKDIFPPQCQQAPAKETSGSHFPTSMKDAGSAIVAVSSNDIFNAAHTGGFIWAMYYII